MLSHSAFKHERFPGESFVVGSSHLQSLHQQLPHMLSTSSSSTLVPGSMQDQILNPSDQMLAACPRALQDQRRLKQHADQVLKCPRCDSLNTKFCYYNNYSLTQPRHFCKNCKRYWTKGGALRNVPVGGGCRKNKRAKQRSTDQASSPVPGEEAALLSSCMRVDGSNSNSSLQHDFSAATSSPGLYEGDGAGLTFERLDQVTRAFSGSSAPISVKWAAQLPAPPTHSLQPFDSNILALNLSGHLKQAANIRLQSGDLSSMLEPQFNLGGPASSSLTDNVPSYNLCLESFGVPGGTGDLQWRLPPRLVTMVEEGHAANGKLLMHTVEDPGCSESFRHAAKGKLPPECMPMSTEIDENGNRSSPDWHPPADGFFELTGDPGYWTNGSWPPDLTMYGMAGSQLL
ncbi:hypothetical protein O6H91_19G009200 [Diphasiastrum complanatum]|uniref:Uncharacterized protein n=4 Tax=Diphasiastrum complanatum TaxID=34168 RepID=A0ACC2ASN4_DIPCM|nr:hypothetical protein O6H91_19G009200 [Diphasiastrum complanatum]KAJ7520521.1 hypothetical protein O6H91_19G009200 [Diphasiastrum complanatum]KAJ7520523.1 hypothetical protein O6H91_19G009200 [Diphasiastrum complanatum]